jgi:DNA-binding transcriptional regulator YdaS (Cro superfamily)
MSAIAKAVEVMGNQSKLADALGVTPGFVSQWLNGVRPVPAVRCKDIEKVTNGKVKREELRPDVFGD